MSAGKLFTSAPCKPSAWRRTCVPKTAALPRASFPSEKQRERNCIETASIPLWLGRHRSWPPPKPGPGPTQFPTVWFSLVSNPGSSPALQEPKVFRMQSQAGPRQPRTLTSLTRHVQEAFVGPVRAGAEKAPRGGHAHPAVVRGLVRLGKVQLPAKRKAGFGLCARL